MDKLVLGCMNFFHNIFLNMRFGSCTAAAALEGTRVDAHAMRQNGNRQTLPRQTTSVGHEGRLWIYSLPPYVYLEM